MKQYINDYLKKDIYPFHMPGHKRNSSFLPFGKEPAVFDMTEFHGMDNLHDPEGIILKSQENCAALYGADESFYLVNGSSVGIMAAILSSVDKGGHILLARNSHKSAYSGLIYAGAKPLYIYPEMTEYGIAGGISPLEVELLLKAHKNITALLITSPTYEGFTSDIEKIAEAAHRHNAVLIVDEAHGAHFIYHDAFPKSAIDLGADIVIQSFHKTLPAFTQSAVLHVKGNLVDRVGLKTHLAMLQSSSPSYLLLLGLDHCVNLLRENHLAYFNPYIEKLENIRTFCEKNKNIVLISKSICKTAQIFDMDIGKLVFYISKAFSGCEAEIILRDRFQVQLEMSNERQILAMTSIADTSEGFKRLLEGIDYLEEFIEPLAPIKKNPHSYAKAPYVLHPSAALAPLTAYAVKRTGRCAGAISGSFITPYPPGIPLIVPGERITEEIIEILPTAMKNKKIKILTGA